MSPPVEGAGNETMIFRGGGGGGGQWCLLNWSENEMHIYMGC